jgi:2-amino-4-hydroxy-6-hydroxymethyldihydropteridine diphosphokinase
MHRQAAIGLGTNLGDRWANLHKALQWLETTVAPPIAASSVWESEPWGYEGQHRYLNQVVLLRTDLEPQALLRFLLGIEKQMGRDRRSEGATVDRIIDLDLLALEGQVEHGSDPRGLVLPHPRLELRRFVLLPLLEVWPTWVHPVLGQDVATMLQHCPDASSPVPYEPKRAYTETLA